MTTNTTPTDPSLILAGIIREVDGAHRLGAAALAEAILAHPASQWGPELPPQPPGSPSRTVNWRDLCAELLKGLDENQHEQVRYPGHLRIIMDQARIALQCQSEQTGSAPTPAPAFPEISDQLIRSLIGDVLAVTGTATEESCLNRYWNPVPEVRAQLCEILQLAAKDGAE